MEIGIDTVDGKGGISTVVLPPILCMLLEIWVQYCLFAGVVGVRGTAWPPQSPDLLALDFFSEVTAKVSL